MTLEELRLKWAEAKKKGDLAMCKIIEAQAACLKKGKKPDLYDQAERIFK